MLGLKNKNIFNLKNKKNEEEDEEKEIVNVPQAEMREEPYDFHDLAKDLRKRVSKIREEFISGFGFLQTYSTSVTIFGSARTIEHDKYYQKAQSLAKRLAQEGFAIVTGGGPGIMEAANRGAYRADGESIGFNIELAKEQRVNPYVKRGLGFHYFFTRKVMLAFSAEAYVYFPGGFGTLDEFFEIITLVQTKKIPRVPIILVGSEYWSDFDDIIKNKLLKEYKAISDVDVNLYHIIDDEDEIVNVIKNKCTERGRC